MHAVFHDGRGDSPRAHQFPAQASPLLPLHDANGVYFVLTAADVEETSGFCTDYCSWHHHAKVGAVSVKYAFVGDPSRCAEACELAPGNTPNGDAAGDSMVADIKNSFLKASAAPR